mmetsp:Transcript_9448/g.14162  ORF Transcript_9448/g.14162 Transcript_9448/m.14162 type:complete len:229 (+) Transcript_9448:35-721(+)
MGCSKSREKFNPKNETEAIDILFDIVDGDDSGMIDRAEVGKKFGTNNKALKEVLMATLAEEKGKAPLISKEEWNTAMSKMKEEHKDFPKFLKELHKGITDGRTSNKTFTMKVGKFTEEEKKKLLEVFVAFDTNQDGYWQAEEVSNETTKPLLKALDLEIKDPITKHVFFMKAKIYKKRNQKADCTSGRYSKAQPLLTLLNASLKKPESEEIDGKAAGEADEKDARDEV